MNIIIIAVTIIISVIAFYNVQWMELLKFNAYKIKHDKQGWRFFSYALVHAGWFHLFINMWVLYSFGNIVLRTFGVYFGSKATVYYLLLYVGGILFSILFDYGKQKNNIYYHAVGASGAVAAVVFATIIIYPSGGIYLFPIPFSIPSWLFGILFLVYSAYMQKQGKSRIAHGAHFWGSVYGILFTIITVPHVLESFFHQLF